MAIEPSTRSPRRSARTTIDMADVGARDSVDARARRSRRGVGDERRAASADRATGARAVERHRRGIAGACRARIRTGMHEAGGRGRTSGCRCRRCRSTSRSLSPTRSTIAWKSSSAAMPCWMLLITASSAARCSLSFSSAGLVEQRAFSSAMPMRGDRREQAHLGVAEGVFALVVLEDDAPRMRSPATIGTRRQAAALVGAWPSAECRAASCSARVFDDRRLRARARSDRAALPGVGVRTCSAGACRARRCRAMCDLAAARGPTSGCRCRRSRSTSRSLSPTRSTIAWKSSSATSPAGCC